MGRQRLPKATSTGVVRKGGAGADGARVERDAGAAGYGRDGARAKRRAGGRFPSSTRRPKISRLAVGFSRGSLEVAHALYADAREPDPHQSEADGVREGERLAEQKDRDEHGDGGA